jgi:hypothetical protein
MAKETKETKEAKAEYVLKAGDKEYTYKTLEAANSAVTGLLMLNPVVEFCGPKKHCVYSIVNDPRRGQVVKKAYI